MNKSFNKPAEPFETQNFMYGHIKQIFYLITFTESFKVIHKC